MSAAPAARTPGHEPEGTAVRRLLSDEDRRQIQDRVEAVETRTGVQIVVVAVPRSDDYPELPFRGFVAGATAAAVAVVVALAVRGPPSRAEAIAAPLAVLAAGLLAGLASAWPAVGRVFLRDERARGEVRQHAKELFLDRECFATARRTAVLILVSLLERRIELVSDRGVRERLPDEALAPVVTAMVEPLRDGRLAGAVLAGLTVLERLLVGAGLEGGGGPDELPDELVDGGAR